MFSGVVGSYEGTGGFGKEVASLVVSANVSPVAMPNESRIQVHTQCTSDAHTTSSSKYTSKYERKGQNQDILRPEDA